MMIHHLRPVCVHFLSAFLAGQENLIRFGIPFQEQILQMLCHHFVKGHEMDCIHTGLEPKASRLVPFDGDAGNPEAFAAGVRGQLSLRTDGLAAFSVRADIQPAVEGRNQPGFFRGKLRTVQHVFRDQLFP